MSTENYKVTSAVSYLSQGNVYIAIDDFKSACTAFKFAKMDFATLGDVVNARRSYIMEILTGRKAGWSNYDQCKINDDEINVVDFDLGIKLLA